ncbi:MAG: site-2 protease family protein [Gammaproteobacteria bacterium]|nr:site-2 protease family protein [Gammaproteobacteria bacterium]
MLAVILAIVPILLAVSFHELGHGWAARQLGDDTAFRMGRMTMNPLRHVDPVGTVVVPGLLLLAHSPFLFGWAKPVPVDWRRLRHPRRDMALVALAGPAANLLMLAGWLLVALAGLHGALAGPLAAPLLEMVKFGIMINSVLMLVNLVPVPPLDGSRVVTALLPPPLAIRYNRLEPYGLIILAVLLVTGVLGTMLRPLQAGVGAIVRWVLGG